MLVCGPRIFPKCSAEPLVKRDINILYILTLCFKTVCDTKPDNWCRESLAVYTGGAPLLYFYPATVLHAAHT